MEEGSHFGRLGAQVEIDDTCGHVIRVVIRI